MGKTVTIYFKNNKVARVTGARDEAERVDAARFGQSFVDSITGNAGDQGTAPPAPATRTS